MARSGSFDIFIEVLNSFLMLIMTRKYQVECQLIVCVCILFLMNTGQPRRHLLTTGWSAFVNKKKLVSGDAVLFLR